MWEADLGQEAAVGMRRQRRGARWAESMTGSQPVCGSPGPQIGPGPERSGPALESESESSYGHPQGLSKKHISVCLRTSDMSFHAVHFSPSQIATACLRFFFPSPLLPDSPSLARRTLCVRRGGEATSVHSLCCWPPQSILSAVVS